MANVARCVPSQSKRAGSDGASPTGLKLEISRPFDITFAAAGVVQFGDVLLIIET